MCFHCTWYASIILSWNAFLADAFICGPHYHFVRLKQHSSVSAPQKLFEWFLTVLSDPRYNKISTLACRPNISTTALFALHFSRHSLSDSNRTRAVLQYTYRVFTTDSGSYEPKSQKFSWTGPAQNFRKQQSILRKEIQPVLLKNIYPGLNFFLWVLVIKYVIVTQLLEMSASCTPLSIIMRLTFFRVFGNENIENKVSRTSYIK